MPRGTFSTISWSALAERYQTEYPSFFAVVQLLMCLPSSSAEAERGFSQLKLVKTNIRSNMGQTLLNNVLCVKLLSPSIDNFDPSEAIDRWNNSGPRARRPYFMDKQSQSKHVSTPSLVSVGQNVATSDVVIVDDNDDNEVLIGDDDANKDQDIDENETTDNLENDDNESLYSDNEEDVFEDLLSSTV